MVEVHLGEEKPVNDNTITELFRKSDSSCYYRKNIVKIIGKKENEGRFPNGSKVNIVEEKFITNVYVEFPKGKKKVYEINNQMGKVTCDGCLCDNEDVRGLVKVLRYMDKHCDNYNSETKELNIDMLEGF